MGKLIMTPGPTFIHEDVRRVMAKEITNPDLDLEFYEIYKDTCDGLKTILNTREDVIILSGEGILGLEAACASLIEEGDKALCIENGIFGEGFGDFVEIYGGEVTYFRGDRKKGLEYHLIEAFLKEHNDFKVATLVHCETPSGITNDIEDICKLLNSYGILTVVDAVSSIGGEKINVDEWKIDIALGGSQKCLSAPPGLTFMSVSERAYKAMKTRKSKIRGFYLNLLIWQGWYENKWFPYTQPISDIYALNEAVNRMINDKERINRHKRIAEACRASLEAAGLELFTCDSHSNTVTTVILPENVNYSEFNRIMLEEHSVMIAGAFGFLKDKVFRIGHMGENCRVGRMVETLKAIHETMDKLGVVLNEELYVAFLKKLK